MTSFLKPLLISLVALFASAQVLAGPVNVNDADAITIAAELKGVGVAKAKAIVAYREEHGNFEAIEQLALVKGIGRRLVELNRENIRLADEKTSSR